MQAGTLNFADGAWFAGAVNVQNGAKLNADNAVIDSLSNAGTVSVDAGKVLSVDTSVINAGVCRSNLSSAADYNWIRDKGYTAGDPGAAFTTEGLDLDPWLLRAGLGLTHNTDNGTEISLRYDAEKRNDFLNQTASVKVRWAF